MLKIGGYVNLVCKQGHLLKANGVWRRLVVSSQMLVSNITQLRITYLKEKEKMLLLECVKKFGIFHYWVLKY